MEEQGDTIVRGWWYLLMLMTVGMTRPLVHGAVFNCGSL